MNKGSQRIYMMKIVSAFDLDLLLFFSFLKASAQ